MYTVRCVEREREEKERDDAFEMRVGRNVSSIIVTIEISGREELDLLTRGLLTKK